MLSMHWLSMPWSISFFICASDSAILVSAMSLLVCFQSCAICLMSRYSISALCCHCLNHSGMVTSCCRSS